MFARRVLPLIVALAGVTWASGTASAGFAVYSFNVVSTDTSVVDENIAEAQAIVEVTDVGVGANQIKFTFKNLGPAAMSITDVYFDDGSLLGIASVVNSPDVEFAQGASPPNLNAPGVDFNTTAGFLASADNPAQDGVNSTDDFVSIIFNLQNLQDYDDVIAALTLGQVNPNVDVAGGLRIGIKVQAFDDDGSAKLINRGPTPVPAPPSVILAGIGVLGFGGWARLRRKFAKTA